MRSSTLFVALAAAVAATGCAAYVDPEPVGYAEVTSVPVEIESGPYVMYEGHPAYFYGDRWWYRDGDRWRYYHREPEVLFRQRGYVQRAPRAPRERERIEAPRR